VGSNPAVPTLKSITYGHQTVPVFIVLHIELHIQPEKIFRISYTALILATVIGSVQQSSHIFIEIQMIAQSPDDFLRSTGPGLQYLTNGLKIQAIFLYEGVGLLRSDLL